MPVTVEFRPIGIDNASLLAANLSKVYLKNEPKNLTKEDNENSDFLPLG